MAIEKIIKFSDAIQPADIINEVVDIVNNADLEEFVGASESQAGKKGIVPAPEAGSEDRYLNADGTWKEVKQNLTIYTSLEQIGITPGEETFASIHNALPINSALEYYADPNNNYNNEFYPVATSYFGVLHAVKLNSTKTSFSFYDHDAISGNEFSTLYLSAYDKSFSGSRTTVWKKVAFDSDLTNLSNSVVKSVNGIKPTNGNVTIDIPQSAITLDMVYPVGSIYLSTNATNPTVLFGGTWEAYAQGRVLIGVGEGTDANSAKKTFTGGATGGEYEHKLTTAEMPSHNHTASTNSTGSHTHTGTAASAGAHTHTVRYQNNAGDSDARYPTQDSYGNGGGTINTSSAGAHTHSVTINSAGAHSHTITVSNAGGGDAHNILQPYIGVYMWRRTA
jgi:microcystin-dependent protein|uniref:Baseplate structural protein n=1 Tax=Podoviridae sp. ctqve24 TaxID=2826580 RepID=A0A8S5MH74_9CAUD|nr:MAG TPA: Baseplate structural protein [Podoviridae sp. ctqve24]